jgi:hypothetical protein
MTLRCKHGDLAIIINETPECRDNIGLVVQVRGPLEYLGILNSYGWRIKPIHHKRMWVQMIKKTTVELQNIYWKYPRCIPDAWLLPIRPTDDDIDISDAQELLKSIKMKDDIQNTQTQIKRKKLWTVYS